MAVLSRRYSGLKSLYRRRDRNSELRLPYGSCHTFQVAKLRSNLESTRTLSGDMLMKDGYRQSGPRRDRAGTTLTPSCGNPEMPRSSATAGSAAPSSATTSPGRSPSWEKLTPAPKSFPTPVSGSTSGERDLAKGDKLRIWLLPTGSEPVACRTERHRFSTTRAPSRNSPSSEPSVGARPARHRNESRRIGCTRRRPAPDTGHCRSPSGNHSRSP